ncbi:MAG: hypothetical protein ABFS86_19710 [Planctomycetota bacterium]
MVKDPGRPRKTRRLDITPGIASPSRMSARQSLTRLEEISPVYPAGPEKVRLVTRLAGASLPTAGEVERLHEALLFLRAHPDDAAVLDATESALRGFAARRDVRRFRNSLADTGIAGTRMQYAFSFPMARWLARRDPAGARIAWDDWEHTDRLDELLVVLGEPAEMPGVDDETISGEEWLANARPEGLADYATLVGRVANVKAAPVAREHLYNQLEVPSIRDLADGPDSRTLARWPVDEPWFHTNGIRRKRPDLRKAAAEPIDVRPVDRRTGEALIDLARAGMSVRIRELEAFDFGHADDAFLADAGRGLLISVTGMLPDRRLMPESLYSGLFLKNGVPVGYWLASALFGTAEIAYNIFPTFRGGEAAWMYSRLLAVVHQFLGATSVTVPKYQIGWQNDEAIDSGAFWFYRKLGFEAVDRDVARLLRTEEARMRKDRKHRSSAATLRGLTVENLVLHLGAPRDDLVGVFPWTNVGHAATNKIAEYGGPGPAGRRRVERAAADQLGVGGFDGWSKEDRRGFATWAPVVLAMPETRRWAAGTKGSLVDVLRSKGARREVDFIRAAAGHRPFHRALMRLCLAWEERNA